MNLSNFPVRESKGRPMKPSSFWPAVVGAAICLLAAIAFCSDILMSLWGWGRHDWDYFFCTHLAVYRSLFEFREWPLWYPWTVGGFPYLGNPQSQFTSPWFVFDLIFGPVVAFKLVIVAHYAICLGGMYWLGRELGLSRLAAVYAAGTFTFSSWMALRVYSGHYTYITLAYMPWVVGLVHRARRSWKVVVPGGLLLGLMILNGTWEVVFTGIVSGLLAAFWGVRLRTMRPVAALALMTVIGSGVAAVKVVPVVDLMRDHNRVTDVTQKFSIDRLKSAPSDKDRDFRDRMFEGEFGTGGGYQVVHGSWGEGTRLEPLAMIIKAFFGRQQRGVTLYFIRSTCWHEYGAYLGLVGGFLCVAALLLRRDAWPWMVLGGFCFVMGLGSFSRFAPYALLHDLPVLRSMHTAPRFFIPALFAASILAAMTLDALWSRLQPREQSSGRARLAWIIPVVVTIALVDSILVGRYSLHGAFDRDPPAVPEKLREPRTVTHNNLWGATPFMLSNRSIQNGYEPLRITPRVHAEGEPGYRGEHAFVAEGDATTGTTQLESWSPNTVKVRVDAQGPGLVVLNRNWDRGWRANSPFAIVNHEGLVAAHVPAGKQVVEFAYHSTPAAIGATVSLISIMGCLLAPIAWRRRREPITAEPSISA